MKARLIFGLNRDEAVVELLPNNKKKWTQARIEKRFTNAHLDVVVAAFTRFCKKHGHTVVSVFGTAVNN